MTMIFRSSSPLRRRGATLPEIIITAGLFLLLLTALVAMSMGASKSYSLDSSKMMADDSASVAVQSMVREIRAGLRTSLSDSSSLTVVLPYVNEQGDYDRTRDGDTIYFYLSDGKLFRKRNVEDARMLARGITLLEFSKNGKELAIKVTTQQQIGTRMATTTLDSQVVLRNEPL